MSGSIFLAGAAGAVGSRLGPLLIKAGYRVFGTTRSSKRAPAIEAIGVEPVIVDVFDEAELNRAMRGVQPTIVIHQLTDLPPGLDPALMADAVVRNARIRSLGTRNLVSAAKAVGARKFIAQSIGWAYAPGPEPYRESDPLDAGAEGARAVTIRGVIDLEREVLEAFPDTGVVLRYGQLYGPGTGKNESSSLLPLHVDAAASAALLAAGHDCSGIFNAAEARANISSEKIIQTLGWSPDFRS